MDTQPPPFFNRGPSPLARLVFFSMLSIALMTADGRFNYLASIRQGVAVALDPLQRVARSPVQLISRISEFFVAQTRLQSENVDLKQQRLTLAGQTLQFQALQTENAYLRKLLDARSEFTQTTLIAEILSAGRDPFSRKITVDKGSLHQVQAGEAVADNLGVIGQVTRVYPTSSEITLITDKGQAVPVLSVRTGLRAIVVGNGQEGTLDIPFMPVSTDIQNGDLLVTSGIDGTYPPGMPVAMVSKIERSAAYPFAKISCMPSAGIERHTQILIVAPGKAPLHSPSRAGGQVAKPKP